MTSGQLVFPGSRGLGSKILAFGSPGHSFPEGNLPPALFPGDSPPPPRRTHHRPSRPPPIPPRGTGGSLNSRIPLPSCPLAESHRPEEGQMPSELCLDHLRGALRWALPWVGGWKGVDPLRARAARRLSLRASTQLQALLSNL